MPNKKVPHVIVIGCSAGGIMALSSLFSNLSATVDTPLVVVQHIAPQALTSFKAVFANTTKRVVIDCEDKTPLRRGSIYFAPPNYHLLCEDQHTLGLTVDETVNFARPSIDVLFESAAKVFGPDVIGVLLTGASLDGARGLRMIERKGGLTFVQDPETAEHKVMPASALQLFKPFFVGSVIDIAKQLNDVATSRMAT